MIAFRRHSELFCIVEDSGYLRLPAEARAEVGDTSTVAVARARRFPLGAAGLRKGKLEVVVRHVVTEASR
jgi:hypothetical protein